MSTVQQVFNNNIHDFGQINSISNSNPIPTLKLVDIFGNVSVTDLVSIRGDHSAGQSTEVPRYDMHYE